MPAAGDGPGHCFPNGANSRMRQPMHARAKRPGPPRPVPASLHAFPLRWLNWLMMPSSVPLSLSVLLCGGSTLVRSARHLQDQRRCNIAAPAQVIRPAAGRGKRIPPYPQPAMNGRKNRSAAGSRDENLRTGGPRPLLSTKASRHPICKPSALPWQGMPGRMNNFQVNSDACVLPAEARRGIRWHFITPIPFILSSRRGKHKVNRFLSVSGHRVVQMRADAP